MENGGSTRHTLYRYKTEEEQSAEDRALDDWIPIYRTTRAAKWWHSTVHNVTIVIGAGVIGFPNDMALLGWGPGITVLVLCWIITLFTHWQMVEMHEIVPGERFDRYHELGQRAFGKIWGFWIVVLQQMILIIGINIVYMITGGYSLKNFHHLVCKGCKDIELTYFIMIFASVHFLLSQLNGFQSIVRISFAAAVMSISYCTIAWGASLHNGKKSDVRYNYKSKTLSEDVLNFFNALGSIMFAFAGCHNVAMEIQATFPSTPEKPSKGPMFRGVVVAHIIIAMCYFSVAFIGYWIFGNDVDENILETLRNPPWLIAMANMFVVIHLIGSYQAYAIPFFEISETFLIKKLKFKETCYLRFISRNIYVAFTMFMAIAFPFFVSTLGFVGGFKPITYFLPCMIWLVIHKPRRFGLSWLINWVCIVFGIVLMIVGITGGLWSIICKFHT